MKKVLSVLLAIVMMFSLVTVAFAEDASASDVETTVVSEDVTAGDETTEEDPLDQIMDMPIWQAKVMVKVAAVVLKIVLVLNKIFDFIDFSEIISSLEGIIGGAEETPEEPTVAPEVTEESVAA